MRFLPVILAMLCGCASPDGGRDVAGIRNSRWIERQSIGVSSEPSSADLVALQAIGITNIIAFNHPKYLVPFGTIVHEHYISTWRQIVGGKKLAGIFDAAHSEVKSGTLAHCRYGANRSGTFYILLLMDHGYTKSEAIKMANKYSWQSSFVGLKSYVEKLKEKTK